MRMDIDQLAAIDVHELRHKMLFGSDFPLITPDRWLADFEKLPIKDEVRPLVLKENGAELLGLRE
jgi:uncharacterized protein